MWEQLKLRMVFIVQCIRPGWRLALLIYGLISFMILIRDDFLPVQYQRYRIIEILPTWQWQSWLLIGLTLLLVAFIEGAFRYSEETSTQNSFRRGPV